MMKFKDAFSHSVYVTWRFNDCVVLGIERRREMSNDVIDGELVEDSNGKWLWRTADGRHIPVENMADNHLRNAAMFLMGMGYAKCTASPIQCVVWLAIFRKEWERRMFQRAYEKKWQAHHDNYDAQKELDETKVIPKQLK